MIVRERKVDRKRYTEKEKERKKAKMREEEIETIETDR